MWLSFRSQMSRLMELARSEEVSPMAVVTGDFNTLPGSPLYRFISQGTLDLSEHHRKILSGERAAGFRDTVFGGPH